MQNYLKLFKNQNYLIKKLNFVLSYLQIILQNGKM